MAIIFTPQFKPTEIVSDVIKKTWVLFQGLMVGVEKDALEWMKEYITLNKSRPVNAPHYDGTQSINKSLKSYHTINRGGESPYFMFGIGKISLLNKRSPHWYFLNFGKSVKGMVIPGRGKYVPRGTFGDGAPSSKLAGTGKGRSAWFKGGGKSTFRAKNGITPINYIQATNNYVLNRITSLLNKLG